MTDRLAGRLLDLAPTEASWRVRQSFAFTQMLYLPDRVQKTFSAS
jgi:hypothetical protein